eukprot:6809030-Karenia_brevis.AAC.1
MAPAHSIGQTESVPHTRRSLLTRTGRRPGRPDMTVPEQTYANYVGAALGLSGIVGTNAQLQHVRDERVWPTAC